MKISIKKEQKNCYKVYANEKLIAIFNEKTIAALNLTDGKECSIEFLKKIILIYKIKTIEKKALQILSFKDYSEKELYLKLTKYTSNKIAKFVVLKMKKFNYVNDLRYANNLVNKLIFSKNKSINFVFHSLTQKGIKKETIEKVIKNLNISETKQIENLIIKKYINKIKDFESKKKAMFSIQKLGFLKQDILSAMKNLNI